MEPDTINLRDLALPNIVEKKILAMPSEQESRVSARVLKQNKNFIS